ncbi:MAG: biotin--[acetyl-CoA-carboxylase] ligase [Candidatus Sumerlaeia bacterium]|nr:biotin--[acetyl-CoA-carboxylase] ligase [Candidatus Sumerlaeia bacterium]
MDISRKNNELIPENIKQYLRTQFIGKECICLKEIDSTNNYALKLMKSNIVSNGTLIISNHQTAGRGRRGKKWFSAKGKALLFTVIFTELKQNIHLPMLTFVGALSVAEGILQNYPQLKPVIRWPNDVLINGKKVAGILAETLSDYKTSDKANSGAILGIGININQTQSDLPEEIADSAGSLFMFVRRRISRLKILISVLEQMEKLYVALEEGQDKKIWTKLKKISSTLGKGVRIKTPDERIVTGTAIDIETDGALVVRLDSGQQMKFYSGDIEEVQWSD